MIRTRKHGTAPRQLASGRWQAQADLPNGTRRALGTFETESKAWAAKRAAEVDLARGVEKIPTRTPRFAEFAAEYVDGRERARELKPGTLATYRSSLRRDLLTTFGHLRLDEITVRDVDVEIAIEDLALLLAKIDDGTRVATAQDRGVVVGALRALRAVVGDAS